MNLLHSIILGLLQGLSEFLPISSTAHLTLYGKIANLIDLNSPEKWTAFLAVVQLGTMLAVLIYFSRDLVAITRDFKFKKYSEQSANSKLGWLIIFGSVPIGVLGIFLKNFIEGTFTKSLFVISINLILFAILLALAEFYGKRKKEIGEITILDSIVMGIAQSFALIPGASRSGTTITGGLFMGLKREAAARFSFLLSIPAVLASGVLELQEALHYLNPSQFLFISVATFSAFVSGILTIHFFLRFLRLHSNLPFIIYRIILGISILVTIRI